jgi:hypothetical protein
MRIASGAGGSGANYPGAPALMGEEAAELARRALWDVHQADVSGGSPFQRDVPTPDGWQPDAEDLAAYEELVR